MTSHLASSTPAPRRPLRVALLPLVAALAMAGCGGGGGSDTDPPPPAAAALALSGVAAVGAPIAGATLSIRCAGTAGVASAVATSASNGSYSVSVSGATLPCAVRATGGTVGGVANAQVLHALAAGAATATAARINVTPLTELMMARHAGGSTTAFFDAVDAARLALVTPAALTTALEALRGGLPEALRGALGNVDPVGAEFAADGTGLDAVLDSLRTTLAAAGISLDAAAAALAGGQPLLPAFVTGLSVTHAAAGDTVTLTGHGLPASPVVLFGGTAAASASVNAARTQVSATLPAGLAGGATTVRIEGVIGALPFTVDATEPPPLVLPTVSGLDPINGAAGTVITVTGSGFGSAPVVRFGSAVVTPSTVSATAITLAVPAGLTDGTYAVSVDGVAAAQSFALSTPVTPPPGGSAGVNWTQITDIPLAFNACKTTFSAAAQGPTRWVAVGDSGCVRNSVDGLTWSDGSQPYTGFSYADVIHGGGRFVAVGTSGYSAVSTDGLSWTRSERTRLATPLYAVVWTGSRYVAVGDTAAVPNYGVNVYTSTDGLNWTEGKVTADASASASLLKLVSVAVNGDTLVAVGGTSLNGRVAWRSTDGGSTWAYVGESFANSTGFILGSGGNPATSVAYGNGRWVAIGGLADWAVSSDGLTWSTGKIDPSEPVLIGMNRVYFDGTQFIAVGRQKRIYTSADGQAWTRRHVDVTINQALTAGNFRGIAGSASGRLVVTGVTSTTTGAAGFMTSVP